MPQVGRAVTQSQADQDDDSRGHVPDVDPAGLWAEFAPPLRAFLTRRVPPGVEADDLMQEVFLRVVQHLGSLRRTDRPEAWLYQIARNALRDSLRARLRRDGRTDTLDFDVAADTGAAADRAAEAELAPCLAAMVGRLDEPYRTAITLTSLKGLTQTAAARQSGVSVSGMKSRVQRGREQLRRMLVQCCAIAVDVRGGISDFHLRQPQSCQGPVSGAVDACSSPCAPDPGANPASLKDDRRL